MNVPISVFPNARSTSPTSIPLETFLKSQKHRGKIEELRRIEDKKQRDELKKSLPAATISGDFTKREIGGIKEYNGLICLDFDGKENPDVSPAEMRQRLGEFNETLYAGLSVSGTGVFAIIRTDNTDPIQHSAAVDYLGGLISRHLGLIYDRSCKDVCRLRFVSYDPDAIWNPDATAFPVRAALDRLDAATPPKAIRIRKPRPESDGSFNRKKVEALIEVIEANYTDITDNYDEWLTIGMAFANEFGAEGEEYFHRVSLMNPKYNYSDAEKKYKNLLQTASGRVKIGSFFFICNQKGVRI